MDDVIKIGDFLIGEGCPTFIIAEAGINHNGDLDLAKRMVKEAKRCGCNAVKFQSFTTENLLTKGTFKVGYVQDSPYDLFKRVELSKNDFEALINVAREEDILFLSTPFDPDWVDFLDSMGITAIKVASGNLTNIPLLRHIACKERPILLSTGMSSLGEIEEALFALKETKAGDIALLHCTSAYPTPPEEVNLRTIRTLRECFPHPVGFSDHTISLEASIAAVTLGACIIEKHFTLDKSLPGPDQKLSLEPEEMRHLVQMIRNVEKSLGDGTKTLTPSEVEVQRFGRTSLVATRRIKKGTILTQDLVTIKRPGTGIPPKFLNWVIGRRARADIDNDEVIRWEVV